MQQIIEACKATKGKETKNQIETQLVTQLEAKQYTIDLIWFDLIFIKRSINKIQNYLTPR